MKEPVGLTRLDGKRPDGLTLIPWQDGKSLTWDVTVVSTLADSHLHVTSHSAGGAAKTASVRKESNYSTLPSNFLPTDRLRESRPAEWVGSRLFERGRSSLECFIPRSTRDLFPVPAAVSLDTALPTTRCSFLSNFVLTKIRTSSYRGYFIFSFLFLAIGLYTPEGIKNKK